MIYALCVVCLETGWIYISAIRRKKVHSLEACWKWILLTEAFEAKCDTSPLLLLLASIPFYFWLHTIKKSKCQIHCTATPFLSSLYNTSLGNLLFPWRSVGTKMIEKKEQEPLLALKPCSTGNTSYFWGPIRLPNPRAKSLFSIRRWTTFTATKILCKTSKCK